MDFENLINRGFSVINGHVYGGTTMKFNSATASIVPVIVKAGGELVAGSGTTTIGNTSTALNGGLIVDPGGRFVGVSNSANRGTGGSIVLASSTAPNYGFYVHGEMDLLPQSAANAATANLAINYGATPPYRWYYIGERR